MSTLKNFFENFQKNRGQRPRRNILRKTLTILRPYILINTEAEGFRPPASSHYNNITKARMKRRCKKVKYSEILCKDH